jgi:hypothetical protein
VNRYIAGAIMVAVIAVVLLWGIPRDNRDEPVWLDGVTARTDTLTVGWDDDLDRTQGEAIMQAIRETNREVGCAVLSPSGTTGVVTILTAGGRPPCGGFVLRHPGRPTTAFCSNGDIDIVVGGPGELQETYLIHRHELGHALGLAHDPAGLMAEHFEVTEPLHSLSPKDRKALQSRFCQ